MADDDVLGDDGREAIHSCVKVHICSLDSEQESLEKYDRDKALEKLETCYRGSFPQGFSSWLFFDPLALFDSREGHNISKMKRTYNIITIHEALFSFDQISYVAKYPEESDGPTYKELKELIDKRRADVDKELAEARRYPDAQREYSWIVAQRRVRDCFSGNFAGDRGLLNHKPAGQMYTITEVYDTFQDIDKCGNLLTYPEDEGPGSEELKTLIDGNREKLIKEENEAKEKPFVQREYSHSQAERRLRDCFAGTVSGDTDIFPVQKNTYNISEIKDAIDNFDNKKLIEKYREGEKLDDVDDARDSIQAEYEKAISETEVSYGSGFIIEDGTIVTNKHVIEDYLGKPAKYRIYISNEVIDGVYVPCKVADWDPQNDLASLNCSKLFWKKISEIRPLQLSNEPLLTGQKVFCFGYPIHYTGKKALFVEGRVSGEIKKLYGPQLAIINCSISRGNSGSPVLRRKDGQLKVVGVVKEQHIKYFLTPEQIEEVEDLMTGLHFQFNFGNVLPAQLVSNFVQRNNVDPTCPGGIVDSIK
nr:uncharacterized protein LOC131779679 [Pocillopora verrucosa]